ncbi:MAG: hypothetical protein AAFQ41_05560 [Cyanobacteria bacterium J06623_7]
MKSNQFGLPVSKFAVVCGIFPLTLTIVLGLFWFDQKSPVEPERLGNPLSKDGLTDRALNIWDLQAFDGKIYLGGGSTVTNSGPMNIWAYDPESKDFVKEHQVPEEAIEHYRVLNNRLYIPAADPVEGDKHKFYRREGDRWRRYSHAEITLAHVRDLIATEEDEILMVGNNRQYKSLDSSGTALATFEPEGIRFQPAGIENVVNNGNIVPDFNWFFSVFRYQNRIFATNSILRDADNYPGAIAEYDPKSRQFVLDFNLRNDEFIPQNLLGEGSKQGLGVIYRPWKPVEFQDYLVYPVRSYSIGVGNYQKAYMNSIGFFYKSGMGQSPQELELPQGQGEDVLVIDGELYVLANRKNSDARFINYVYRTERLGDKVKWQQVVEFESWNKARSFEHLDGTFYFGLGHDYGEAANDAGDILSYTPRAK